MTPELLKGTAEEIKSNIDKIKDTFLKPDPAFLSDQSTAIDEYKLKHKILERVDKVIEVETENEDGTTSKVNQTIVYKKLLIPFQKKIVRSAVSFLFGKPIHLVNSTEDKDNFDYFKEIWKKLKLDTLNRKVAKKVFIEREAAELYYVYRDIDKNENKIRVLLLCMDNTNSMHPYYDENGDLIVFSRAYTGVNEEGKEIEKVDLYTDEYIIKISKQASDYEVLKEENLYKKIPVIYYPKQEQSEWSDVQTLIERFEELLSKSADTNDYFGAPTVVSKGSVRSIPEKDEQGKFIEIEDVEHGDVKYLTWDHAPESVKTEYNMLKEQIHSQTDTPDLSFDNVKGINNVSGIALELMFLGALHKAMEHQELFGEMLERRINLLKVMIGGVMDVKQKGVLELDITAQFQESLPDNIKEKIEILTQATGGKAVMSQKTAVNNNPLIINTEEEIAELERENQGETERINNLDRLYQ